MMSCTVNAQSMTSCTVSRLCVSSFGRVERFPLLDQDINGNNYVRSPEFQSGVCLFKYSKNGNGLPPLFPVIKLLLENR